MIEGEINSDDLTKISQALDKASKAATVTASICKEKYPYEEIKWEQKIKSVCFNIFCVYEKPKGKTGEFEKCKAGTSFTKNFTQSGDEIFDVSSPPSNPDFDVECDGRRIFSSSAHRYTDHLGTRSQAIGGPFPAILLPKGALKDGRRYSSSSLELAEQKLRGACYIYTGPQLMAPSLE